MHCPIGVRAAALLGFLINSSYLLLANAKTIPRIIDDTYGDQATGLMPVYYPQGDTIWQRNCSAQDGCLIVPDPALTQNGTWTAATYRTSLDDMGLRLQFKGTAISVYFIIANNVGATSYVTTTTEARFTMDGVFKSTYIHEPTSRLGLQYNVEVYNETGLDDRLHTLDISTGKLDHEVYIAFDHAKYMAQIAEDNERSGEKTVRAGAIVGLVIGAIAFLLALVVGFLLIRRHRHAKEQQGIGTITPLFLPQDPESTLSSSHPDDRPHSALCTATNVQLLNGYRQSSEKQRSHAASTVTLPHLTPNPPHNLTSESTEASRLLQQVNRMVEQLQVLQRQDNQSAAGSTSSSGQMAELREEIRRLQLQLASLQNQNRSLEEPPGYTLSANPSGNGHVR